MSAVRSLSGRKRSAPGRPARSRWCKSLSRESTLILGADVVPLTEGNTDGRDSASAQTARRGRRHWHVRTLFAREPGEDLHGFTSNGGNLARQTKRRTHRLSRFIAVAIGPTATGFRKFVWRPRLLGCRSAPDHLPVGSVHRAALHAAALLHRGHARKIPGRARA